jgi:allantoinase
LTELIVRGGTVITAQGPLIADIAVDGGRISAIAPELNGAAREIDVRGLTVLPGLIDIHVHFNEPGRTGWEGAATGSRALAAGGGTVFFDMPLNSSPCTAGPEEFDQKRAALEQFSITDFALWGGIIPGNRSALAELAARGVIGFKAFMADSGLPEFPRCDDRTLAEGMREAARLQLPVAVHAEDHELVSALASSAISAGKTSIRHFLDSRPVKAELMAIQRASQLAAETGVKLHIVHVSSGSGVATALEARASGVDISIETCPHYLFFTEEDMERIGPIAKCAPPLRDAGEHDALWNALMHNQVDVVASDHSPSPPEMKRDADFFHVWGGIAGVQSTLAVLLTAGHQDRGLPLSRIAEMTASWPVRRFRLVQKGGIAVGNDADLVLVDLSQPYKLQDNDLLQRHKMSPYIGRSFRGVVRQTLLRGQPIFSEGKIVAASKGKFINANRT